MTNDDINGTGQRKRPPRTLVQRATSWGLPLGLYLIGLALLCGTSMSSAVAGLLIWVGTIYFPFYLYKLLRQGYAETDFRSGMAEIWAEGIASIFLGSAIQALFIYVALRYIDPGFIATVWQTTIDTLKAQPGNEFDAMVAAFERVQRIGALPSPVDVMVQVMTMNLMGGTILSLIEAALIVSRYSDAGRRERYIKKYSSDAN